MGKTVNLILKNSSALVAGRLIAKAVTFCFVFITARYLGVGRYGQLSFALSLTGLFAVFLDLGTSQHGIRELARTPSKTSQYLGNVLFLRFCLVVLALSVMAAFLMFTNRPDNQPLVLILSLAIALGAFSGVPSILFQATQRMEFDAFREILKAVLLLSTGFIAIKLGKGALGIAAAYVAVAIFDLIFSFVILKKYFPGLSIKINSQSAKTILKESIPLALLVMGTQVYSRVDIFMLQALDTTKAVGFYNAAYRFVDTSLMFSGAFCMALYPVLTKLAHERDAFDRYMNSSLKLLSYSGLFLGLGVFFASDAIIHIVFGSAFAESSKALRVLVWANAVMFIGGFLATSMIAINKQWLNFGYGLAQILVNVVLDWIFISRYGFVGAAVGTTLAELFYVALVLSYIRFERKTRVDFTRVFVVPLGAASAVMLIAWFLPAEIKTSYMGLMMTLPLYSLAVYFFGINKEEKQMLFGLLAPRRADL
jgi:O-antigen/teichoic acid export membrane protein